MSLEADLKRVISSPGTKSDRARALFRLGCDRTDAVELLGMNYSQAHSIWSKEFADVDLATGRTAIKEGTKSRTGNGYSRLADVRSASLNERGRYNKTGSSRHFVQRGRLNLGPTQVRVVTQDKHEVIRDLGGVKCFNCEKPITFSLRYLGFVHTYSKKEPMHLEDRYD